MRFIAPSNTQFRRQPRRAFLAGLLAIFCAAGLLATGAASAPAADEQPAKMVRMVIDFGDGVEVHFSRLPWKKGQTVADAMALTDARPHGAKFTRIGAGETMLATQIGDVKNEGGGPDRRNWLYRINGKLADNGIGVQTLEPGDVVLWKFDRYEYNPKGSK